MRKVWCFVIDHNSWSIWVISKKKIKTNKQTSKSELNKQKQLYSSVVLPKWWSDNLLTEGLTLQIPAWWRGLCGCLASYFTTWKSSFDFCVIFTVIFYSQYKILHSLIFFTCPIQVMRDYRKWWLPWQRRGEPKYLLLMKGKLLWLILLKFRPQDYANGGSQQ